MLPSRACGSRAHVTLGSDHERAPVGAAREAAAERAFHAFYAIRRRRRGRATNAAAIGWPSRFGGPHQCGRSDSSPSQLTRRSSPWVSRPVLSKINTPGRRAARARRRPSHYSALRRSHSGDADGKGVAMPGRRGRWTTSNATALSTARAGSMNDQNPDRERRQRERSYDERARDAVGELDDGRSPQRRFLDALHELARAVSAPDLTTRTTGRRQLTCRRDGVSS